jgi:hypothetical protein
MKHRQILVVVFLLAAMSACADTTRHSNAEITTGKVILVKYAALQDLVYVHGAFVTKEVTPPVKTSTGSIVSLITYEWVLDTPKGRISGKEQVPDHIPIQFGETEASPGVIVGWSYKNPNSGYLKSGILGSEHGSHICVTELSKFPTEELSAIQCQYLQPPPELGQP